MSATGTVVVGDRSLQVCKLTVRGEQGFLNELARQTKRGFGPGGYFQRAAGAIDWLKEQKRGAEFARACDRIAELEATGATPSGDAVEEFRQSPGGVALELYWRTRTTHAEVTQDQLAAVVTETNALDVYLQILDVLTDEKKA